MNMLHIYLAAPHLVCPLCKRVGKMGLYQEDEGEAGAWPEI